jgi:RNA-directed DNA polymerase
MLRPDGYRGKVREGYLVSVPDCSVDTTKARCSKRHVFAKSAWYSRCSSSSWQVESGFKDLHRRRADCELAVLDAIPALDSLTYTASTSDSSDTVSRGWFDVGCVDKAQAKAGIGWVKMRASLGATGTTGLTPVLAARTGTTLRRTRTTTSVRAFPVTASHFQRSAYATAVQAGQSKCGQPVLSSLGKYSTWFGRTPSRKSKSAADFFMVKKHRNLIDKITTLDNLRLAYEKTSRGKKMSWGYLEFKEYAEANLLQVQQELADGAYKIGAYREFTIYEPKPRQISALDFKDRLVQHALCNVIAPIFEKTLMPQTFACRVGFGTHAGVQFVQSKLRQNKPEFFLKTDYSKFFPSIDRPVLHTMIDRKIDCDKTLRVLREIIPTTGKGIPIGSLTSQLFANVYGNAADRFIHFNIGERTWARYMDDIVVLGNDKNKLMDCFLRLNDWSMEHLKLRIGKWQVSPTSQGVNFLGYRIWSTHKLLRKDSVIRAKRKVANFVNHNDMDGLSKFTASWSGHTQWANSYNLNKWMEQRYGITF